METAVPSKSDDHKYDDYAVKRAVETLMEAEEIKSDSKMMALVKEQMDKKGKHIKKVSSLKELRSIAAKKSAEEPEEKSEKVDDEEMAE